LVVFLLAILEKNKDSIWLFGVVTIIVWIVAISILTKYEFRQQ
jgi:hypothetical protein